MEQSQARPELSVVVICYNGKEYLPGCLSSLRTELKDIRGEVVLVDNASADDSADFVRAKFPEFRLIVNERNLGFTRAVNIGLDVARGEVILLLNQDTRARAGAIRAMLDKLKADDSIGILGPKFVSFDGKLQPSARAFPAFRHVWYDALLLSFVFKRHREFSSWRMGWFDHEHEMAVDQPMGAAMMVRRTVVEEVGNFDESFPMFFSDVDYCKRVRLAGYHNVYFPGAVVEHAVGGSTRVRPWRWRFESHRSMYRYLGRYSRWYSRPWLWLTGVVLFVGLAPSLVFLRLVRTDRRRGT